MPTALKHQWESNLWLRQMDLPTITSHACYLGKSQAIKEGIYLKNQKNNQNFYHTYITQAYSLTKYIFPLYLANLKTMNFYFPF